MFWGLDRVACYEALRLAREGHGLVHIVPVMTHGLLCGILSSTATVPDGAVEAAENVFMNVWEKFLGIQNKTI